METERCIGVSADFGVERDVVRQPALDGFRREEVAIEMAKDTISSRFFDEVEAQLEVVARLIRRKVIRRDERAEWRAFAGAGQTSHPDAPAHPV